MFKIILNNCCGLDVHKSRIYACIGITDTHSRTEYYEANFSSFPKDLRKLSEWLHKYNCVDVCILEAMRLVHIEPLAALAAFDPMVVLVKVETDAALVGALRVGGGVRPGRSLRPGRRGVPGRGGFGRRHGRGGFLHHNHRFFRRLLFFLLFFGFRGLLLFA